MKIFRSRFTLAFIIASGAVVSVTALPLLSASPFDGAASSPESFTGTLPLSRRDSEGCTKPLGECADKYRYHEDKCPLDLQEACRVDDDIVNILKRGGREGRELMSFKRAQEYLTGLDKFDPNVKEVLCRLYSAFKQEHPATVKTFLDVGRDWNVFLSTRIGQSVIYWNNVQYKSWAILGFFQASLVVDTHPYCQHDDCERSEASGFIILSFKALKERKRIQECNRMLNMLDSSQLLRARQSESSAQTCQRSCRENGDSAHHAFARVTGSSLATCRFRQNPQDEYRDVEPDESSQYKVTQAVTQTAVTQTVRTTEVRRNYTWSSMSVCDRKCKRTGRRWKSRWKDRQSVRVEVHLLSILNTPPETLLGQSQPMNDLRDGRTRKGFGENISEVASRRDVAIN
ncbi:hypothetical protein EV360DRAFT_70993 [Lentinula raphanica]|nr:hypothetical protein EV360DRAFT_70993 [Lentinula raphanica]